MIRSEILPTSANPKSAKRLANTKTKFMFQFILSRTQSQSFVESQILRNKVTILQKRIKFFPTEKLRFIARPKHVKDFFGFFLAKGILIIFKTHFSMKIHLWPEIDVGV